MQYKIEKVPLPPGPKAKESNESFILAVRDLKPGESFVCVGFGPYQRNAISVLQFAYERRFAARQMEDGRHRIFRVA